MVEFKNKESKDFFEYFSMRFRNGEVFTDIDLDSDGNKNIDKKCWSVV